MAARAERDQIGYELVINEAVRAPDGRVGTVIGFYRNVPEMVVVRFAPGDTEKFPTTEVERVA
jgi:hypothetical protein